MKFSIAAAGLALASSALAYEIPLAVVTFVQSANITTPFTYEGYNDTCVSLKSDEVGVTNNLVIQAEGGHDPECVVWDTQECCGEGEIFHNGQTNFQHRFISASFICYDQVPE